MQTKCTTTDQPSQQTMKYLVLCVRYAHMQRSQSIFFSLVWFFILFYFSIFCIGRVCLCVCGEINKMKKKMECEREKERHRERQRRMSPMVVDIHKRYSTHLAVDFDPLKQDSRWKRNTHRNAASSKLILNWSIWKSIIDRFVATAQIISAKCFMLKPLFGSHHFNISNTSNWNENPLFCVTIWVPWISAKICFVQLLFICSFFFSTIYDLIHL